MPISAYQAAAYPSGTGEAVIWLVVIEHDSLDEPIRLTDAGGTYDDGLAAWTFTADGETYFAAPVVVEAPGQSDESAPGRITVPNIDQRIGAAIELIDGPPTVTLTAVLESDPETPLATHQLLLLQNVKGDAMAIQADLTRPDLTDEPWPKEWIRPGKFRAAFRAI